jgi:hypothetical protein
MAHATAPFIAFNDSATAAFQLATADEVAAPATDGQLD